MLKLPIEGREYYDENLNKFITVKSQVLVLEHSLLSISKWEAKWKKSFLSNKQRTLEESLDYIRCMTINQVDPSVYYGITNAHMEKVNEYINDTQSATTFSKNPSDRPSREVITSELIYYWMVALQIPFECEKWHLNRLLTLIRICNIKNAPPKSMSKNAILSSNAALNKARRQALHSKG